MKITPVHPREPPYTSLYSRHSEATAIDTSLEDPANTASDLRENTNSSNQRWGATRRTNEDKWGGGWLSEEDGVNDHNDGILEWVETFAHGDQTELRRWGQEENSESGDGRKTTLNT